jgi:hypothetical protein
VNLVILGNLIEAAMIVLVKILHLIAAPAILLVILLKPMEI